jgi:KDO2-lipid IV(A) lauroyltransferase
MWKALQFYLSMPFLFLISLLPFRILWVLSDVLYFFVITILGYRKNITYTNIKKAFPEKSEIERNEIARRFYHFLCDQVMISIKAFTTSGKSIMKRCSFINTEVVEKYKGEGKKILFVLGHYGMWEISGSAFGMYFHIDLSIAYKPLANKYFNKFVVRSRSRFGNRLIAKRELLRYLDAHKNTATYLALIADQSPNPKEHYWVKFLGRETAVVTGMEKIAKLYDFTVVYAGLQDAGRGRNLIRFKLLTDNARALPE